jgi:hypothetical protein
MDYGIYIPNKIYDVGMPDWVKANVYKNHYLWDIAPGARALFFKFEADLLVFRLRWGV